MPDSVLIIVKISERCNLDCSYCYMYHAADQSWKSRPAILSVELQDALIERCAEYLAAEESRTVTLEFHGGEPLLVGLEKFEALLERIEKKLGPRADIILQTNGVLLSERWLDLFEQFNVSWSISCDGPSSVNDRFRRDHMGRPSLSRVQKAIDLSMARESDLFGSVLAVIDPDSSARETVRFFHKMGVRECDLLLPDASHITPPPHIPDFDTGKVRDYLIEMFDTWIEIGDPNFRIRFLTHVLKALFGAHSGLDAFGGELSDMIVVESDGSYQFLDVLRINGHDQVNTGLSLNECGIDEYLQRTRDALPKACETCRSCPAFNVCGGGYLPHRFDGEGYDNPSVYCDALYSLIGHANVYLQSVTPKSLWKNRRQGD